MITLAFVSSIAHFCPGPLDPLSGLEYSRDYYNMGPQRGRTEKR